MGTLNIRKRIYPTKGEPVVEKKEIKYYRRFTDSPQVNRLLNRLLYDVQEFTETQLDHIKRLASIGAALSAERNLERLFEMIIDEARKYTSADGGTLYIVSDDETQLEFAIAQNDTLKIRMGGTAGKITWPPVKLCDPEGNPNHAHVSAYVALSGKTVNIPDVYDAEGFNFEGTRKFDATTGYRSQSMLVVPMQNHENEIIGVLQLLNALDRDTGQVVPFSPESEKMAASLASQAAVALSNNRLIQDLENLLESFIKTIATAIDEKSPYTGGHVRRVADLTITIAQKINTTQEGPYAKVHFTENQLNELRIAAWLHDVGKITTPEHVVDKATKLEGIYDRIGTVKTRVEIMKRDYQIAQLQKGGSRGKVPAKADDEGEDYLKTLEEDFQFLMNANIGAEFMADEKIERLKSIARRFYIIDSESRPFLDDYEVLNLSIRRGTLTNEERNIINNHATVTMKMLTQLPFPKKLRHVPLYAATHHEKLDGTGYPSGLKGEDLPLQSRILALADIFEALTARDRPYKKGKTLSEAMKIMEFMVKDKNIDPDLFAFFVKEGIYLDYARRELPPHQLDMG